jgi:filamentous hemagglutinin family protein
MNERRANHRLLQAIRSLCGNRAGLAVPAALLGFNMVSVAVAGPTGGIVVGGEATISTPAAGRTVIDQASQHVQINWNTFNVGASESVRFNQPSSSSVALNRILDQSPSQIFGRIDANGHVILVNPNGMLFGPSAQLNVGSLVASSLDVIGFDPVTGRYSFGSSRADVGAIVNQGTITAAAGGSVTLLGGRVTNEGSILADFGTVNLAAGRTATLDLAGDGLLRLEVDGELFTNGAGAGAAVENNGVIQANGGQILLSAQALDGVFANLVNNTGVVRANRIDNSGGTIRLVGDGGTVRSSGVLDASAGDAVSSGGRVELLGEHVGLFDSALVDVSGATNGGSALIGGDYQGKNPEILNAARTYVGSDAVIRADAGLVGDGGRVIVWADEITRFNGTISARGGSQSGDGGFAEVSGKDHLVFRGRADLSATHGDVGVLLLDPTNITIDASNATDPDLGADGTLAFAESPGNVTIGNARIVELLETTNVVLQATNDIEQLAGATIDVSGVDDASGRSLTLEAGGSITLNDAIVMNDGAVTLIADSAAAGGAGGGDGIGAITMADGSLIDAGSGDVSLTAAEDIRVTSITTTGTVSLTSSDGAIVDDGDNATQITATSVTLSAAEIGSVAGRIGTNTTTLNATATNGGIYITEADDLTLSASATGGDVDVQTVDGDLSVNAASGTAVRLSAGGANNSLALNGIVNAGAGDVTLTAGSAANRGAITANPTSNIIAGLLDVTGSSIGTTGQRLHTNVASLTATATNGGIFITESNGLTLTNVSAAGVGSDIDISSTTGNIVVGAVSAADEVRLSAVAGSVLDDGNNGTVIQAGALTLSAGGAIGTSGLTGQIDTNVTSLTATAAAGSIYVGEANGLSLSNVSASGAGSEVVVTSATGNIEVGAVSATSRVELTASSGSILDDGLNSTQIQAQSLSLTASGSIGGSDIAEQIDTNVVSLEAATVAGSIYIGEANGLTLSNVSAGGAGSDVVLTSQIGNITVGSVSAGNAVTLSTAAGSILDDGNNATTIQAQTLTLSATGVIGGSGATGQIDTNVSSLTATATGGSVYIGEANGLTLTNVSAGGAGGDIHVTSATGDIQVGSVSAPDVVTLIASAGSITDDGNNATRISGQTLTLTAGTGIGSSGASGQIDTDVASLAASAANGGIYIDELNGVTLTQVTAGGANSPVNIVSTTGNIVAGEISATGTVTLRAMGGAITDDDNDATVISGNMVSLIAATNIGTVVDFAAANDADVGSSVDVQTNGLLNAFVDSNTGQINLNISGAPTLSANSIAVGDGAGRAGFIVLQSAGDLNMAGFSPGAIELGSGNTTSVGLRSGGVLTLPSAGGFTDHPASHLLVRGAVDVVDTDATPREFTLSATTLDFRSGSAGGATTLNTTVGQLSASIGNDQNLTVNETDGLTVGTLDVGAGNIVLTANGAVSDDGNDATRIVANSASLSGTSLGASGNALDTQVNMLNVTSTNGGVYISEADAVALTVSATGGAADVRTTNGALTVNSASGTGVTLVAGGAGNGIALNGAVNSGVGDVTLTAGTAVSRGAIVAGAGAQVIGNALTATGSTIGSSVARLNTSVGSLNVTSTNGGIYITEADGVTLTAAATNGSVDVRTTNGAIAANSVTGAGVTLIAGGAGDITVSSATSTGAGDVVLTTNDGSISLSGAVSTAGGAVSLTAGGAGAVTVSNALQTAGGDVTLATTNGAIALNGAVNTAGGNATLTAGGTGAITINDTLQTGGGDVTLTTTNAAIALAGAITTSGGDVTATADGAGNGITVGSTVNAGAGNVTLTAGTAANRGAIVSTAVGQIIANSLTAVGSSVGSSATRLNTALNSLDVTSTEGGLFITEADALNLTASATNGAVDVRTNNGAITATAVTGNGVTLIAGGAAGGITVNGAVNAGPGDVTMTAGGAIALNGAIQTAGGDVALTTTNGSIGLGSAVSTGGGDVTLSAGGAGALAVNDTVQTSGGTVTLTTTNGSIGLGGAVSTGGGDVTMLAGGSGALAVNNTVQTGGGDVTLTTANGAIALNAAITSAGGDVTATAGGAGSGITVNGAVNAGAGDVTLTAGSNANRGAIVASAAGQITANSLTATGSAIGASGARLNTTVNSVDATSTNGGIFIDEADLLNLAASATNGVVDVRTTNGAITATSLTGSGVTLAANGAGNGITVTGTVNGGANGVTLTTESGAIAVTGAINTTGGDVTITAAGAGNTIAMNAVQTAGGDVTLTTADGAIALNGAVATAGGDVAATAGGAGNGITINDVVNAGAGNVTLTAGTPASRGAIMTSTTGQIAGNSLIATGSSIGTSAARLNTAVSSVNATSTNGGIYISEGDAVTLAADASNGAVDVRTTNGAITVTSVTASGVTLVAGGAGSGITVNGALNAGAGDVTLTAGTAANRGAIVAGAAGQITANSLTATGASIGTSAARLNTAVSSLNATSSNGGIFVNEADALNLIATATGGALDVQTTNGSISAGALSGEGVILTAGGAGSGISLGGVLNAGQGDAVLIAGTGASRGTITGTAGHSVSARSLTATASSIGANSARFNTAIDSLDASATNGGVYISEQNGLTLASVSAAGDVDVTAVAGGITVGTVDAGGNVVLTASAGAIADDGDDTTRISGNALTLTARSIGAASTLTGTVLDASGRLDTDVTTLNATATAGGIYIDEANDLQNVNVQASGGEAGDIEVLTLAGDLVVQNASASDTLLLAAGRNLLSAPGASAIKARAAELRAGTTDSSGGHIGTLADSLELQLSPGNSLRLFVPQNIDPNDPNRAPATLPSAGVSTTLTFFGLHSPLASRAGFNQFQGIGETQFTSPAEALVRTLQSQTGTVQAGLDIDWVSFDPEVSLFGTLEPSVCLPGDQRDEEISTPEC